MAHEKISLFMFTTEKGLKKWIAPVASIDMKTGVSFSLETKREDKNLQEIIQFEKIDEDHTKIISSMIGRGKGSHWDKVYGFFERGNDWTFKEIVKVFQK